MQESTYNIEDNVKNVVYTSNKLIDKMLSSITDETERIDARVLEPACGNGNFLDAILRCKLNTVARKYSHSRVDFEFYIIRALMSIYGVEIDSKTVQECQMRLQETTKTFYCRYFSAKQWEKFYQLTDFVLKINILCGDALSLTNPNTKEPIVFSEWSFLGSFKVKRRDFIYEQLINPSANAERILSDTRKQNFIPVPVKDYPITKIFKLTSYA